MPKPLTGSITLLIGLCLALSAQSKPAYLQLSDALTLRMSDGEEYVVRAAAHMMTSRTKTHLIVNDQTVDSKVRPHNSRVRLHFSDKGMDLQARCELKSSRESGDVNDIYFDRTANKRNLSMAERGSLAPLACDIIVDDQPVGHLELNKRVKIDTQPEKSP